MSVTPIISRNAENLGLIVKHWLRPSIPVDGTVDQYIKPTGSTTCALVSVIHDVIRIHMLKDNSYVRCLMVDTVDHVILVRKLQALNMPPNVYIG